MKKLFLFCLFAGIVFWGTTASAYFFSETIIYAGPPEYEDLYDGGERPTAVNADIYGKDAQAHAGWWELGGSLSTAWDENFQGWLYVFADMQKEFEVTAPGSATLSFSSSGSLQVAGSSAQNGDYTLYSDIYFYDDTPDPDNWGYWYEELDRPGYLEISESKVFYYDFSEEDVGTIITLDVVFETMISPETGVVLNFAGGERLGFSSSLQDIFKINGISGGIAAVDGPDLPTPVPAPSAIWLLGIALAGFFAIKKRPFK